MANTLQKTEFTVSTKTVIRVLAIVLLWLLFLAALRKATHAIVLIFTAFFLALALNAPVHWIAEHLPGKRKGSRKIGTAVSFLIVIVFLAGFLASMVPPLVRQTNNFIKAAPTIVDDVRDENSSLGNFVRRYNLENQVEKFSSELSDRLKNVGSGAVSGVTKVSGSIFSVLTILVLTFMMLIEGPRWLALGRQLLPKAKRAHADALMDDMYRVVKGFVNGQVFLAALAAVMILVPLLILGVSYPIALMVIVFICGLIPMVGHTIGAVIVSTIALFTSPIAGLVILLYYFLYQQIENYVIQPRVQSNSTNMSPLIVFASVIVGVSFGGLLGGLVAIPVAGSIRILVIDYLHRRNLIPKATARQSLDEPKRS
jgi:predicted PurR-regulated permease PerM